MALKTKDSEPQRGISPAILLEHVRNTMPYLFEEGCGGLEVERLPYLQTLLEVAKDPERPLSHEEYYRLCVSAHFATVATPVPTDVDIQIRQKLWHPSLPAASLLKMAETVVEAASWDLRPVSRRWVESPESGEVLGGHGGEWFSIATGAYGALRKRASKEAFEIAALIVREMQREARVYGEFRKKRDGIGMFKSSAQIAHNLGDLDRVMDMWKLEPSDPLFASAYKAGHHDTTAKPGSPGPGMKIRAVLAEAGDLYRLAMAPENHRHFALRAPRCLRRSPDYLVPIGPFFDDWGALLVRDPRLSTEDLGTVVEALIEGWDRLRGPAEKAQQEPPVGYARALAGMLTKFPGGIDALTALIPNRLEKTLRSGKLWAQISVPRAEFEEQWNARAIRFLKNLKAEKPWGPT